MQSSKCGQLCSVDGAITCDVDAQLAAAQAPWSDAAGVPRRQVRLLQGLQGGDFPLPCLEVVPTGIRHCWAHALSLVLCIVQEGCSVLVRRRLPLNKQSVRRLSKNLWLQLLATCSPHEETAPCCQGLAPQCLSTPSAGCGRTRHMNLQELMHVAAAAHLRSKMAPQCRSASSPSDRSFCSLAASSEARCRSKSAAGMSARVPAKPARNASMRASSSDGACVPLPKGKFASDYRQLSISNREARQEGLTARR